MTNKVVNVEKLLNKTYSSGNFAGLGQMISPKIWGIKSGPTS